LPTRQTTHRKRHFKLQLNSAEKFRVAWNTHDMEAMGRLLTTYADFVNVAGMHMEGRSQIVADQEGVHKTQFRDSVWVTHSVEAQLIQTTV
jgi:uncharacterized protein (TIGR02246 family)